MRSSPYLLAFYLNREYLNLPPSLLDIYIFTLTFRIYSFTLYTERERLWQFIV